ncbi:FkbM family methyltransferase [Streptomyces sp. NPDC003832]
MTATTAPAARRLSRTGRAAWKAQVATSGMLRTCGLDYIPARRTSSLDRILEHWTRMATWRLFGPDGGTVVDTPLGRFRLTDGVTPPSGPQVAGLHDAEVGRWVSSILRTGMTVIDVGANVGYFTVPAARTVGPRGRVVAVEPVPSNLPLLTDNLRLNGITNTEVVEAAVVSRPGPVTMHRSSFTNARGSLLRNACATGDPVLVEGTTLDALAETLDRVDLVKIDAEGADLDVLLGAEELLRTRRPHLVVEFWPRGLKRLGRDPHLLYDLASRHRYTLTVNHRGRPRELHRSRADFVAYTRELDRRNYGYANVLATPKP